MTSMTTTRMDKSQDFYSIVAQAQFSELEAVEKQRERERELARELAEKQNAASMTLMQIAGMKTAKELEAAQAATDVREDERLEAEAKKRKQDERERLHNQFPPPDLKHGTG